MYMLCLVYSIVLYGAECLWNVYGHLIELMVIWWAPQRIWSQFTQTPPKPNKIESNWTWSLPCKHSNKQDELNGHEIKNRREIYSILVLFWGWIEMNMRYEKGQKLKFDQDLCKKLWYELNPRVRCAFGNVFNIASFAFCGFAKSAFLYQCWVVLMKVNGN